MKKRSEEDKLSETSQKRNLKETRYTTGMQGKIINKVNNGGKWVVKEFDDIHSHELTSPSKLSKMRSHKKSIVVSK